MSNTTPDYYYTGSTYEVRWVVDAWELNFYLGNVLKYLARAGKKDTSNSGALLDLEKARRYIDFEIYRLQLIAARESAELTS